MKSAFGVEHEPISKSGKTLGGSLSRMVTNAFTHARKPGETGVTLQVPNKIPGFKTLEPTDAIPKRTTMPEAKMDDLTRQIGQEVDARSGQALRAPTVDTKNLNRPVEAPKPAEPAAKAPDAPAAPKEEKPSVKGKYYALAGILGAGGAGGGAYAYDKKRRANKGE